jgi:hypothetical protein
MLALCALGGPLSKGDILLEPAELIIELVGKLLVKIIPRSIPEEPIGQWDLAAWLWLIGVFVLVIIIIWVVRSHYLRRKSSRER